MPAQLPRVAVIGLGRFGMTLARTLGESGAEVIAIDADGRLVDQIKDHVAAAVRLDSTDAAALSSQEVGKCDVVVVAIGENFEAALLTTVLVRQFGVRRIICRAQSAVHAEIYRQIGAHEVIQPEMQAGATLGRSLASPHIDEVVPLAEGYSLIELHAPQAFFDKTLAGLNLRVKYQVNLVAIKRTRQVAVAGRNVTEEVLSVPTPDEVIHEGDTLVLVGSNDALNRLPKE
ncbi:MAG: TrkA family potassium uptake protein [Planctomycetota bacterium]|nr:TrkA family potassium uptake protein [Planctomycetaceae bacterium]MDQ3331381.1 TrkA family potassium uptake protein [Planctomycetota bacterium]